jgi:lysophospholipase L1-like esterase
MILLSAEFAARWWLRFRSLYHVWPPGLRVRVYPDPDVFPELERIVRFEVNSDGERGDEIPRDGNFYRILVAGGSAPEGYLLDQATSWPGALQRLLNRPEALSDLRAAKVHVGNISRSNIGSQALSLVLERVLPHYRRLDVIILMVGMSDVFRWLEIGTPRTLSSSIPASDVFVCHPEGPFGWTPRAMASLQLLRRGQRRFLRPVKTVRRAASWIGHARTRRARAREIRVAAPDPSPMLDHFERHFRRSLQIAKTYADWVLVARQPYLAKDSYTDEEQSHFYHGEIGKAYRPQKDADVFYSAEVTAKLMALIDSRAVLVADELGIEHLDLMPRLERSLKHFCDFAHFTPAGAGAVAEAVAMTILQHAARRP